MAKRKFHIKSKFAMLATDLLESDAFLALKSKSCMFVLIRFHQKVFREKSGRGRKGLEKGAITNNGQIVFTYSEARDFGLSAKTFWKALRELIEEKGFIDIADHGNPFSKKPTKFAIAERWRDYGTPNYKGIKVTRQPDKYGFQKK